MTINVSLSESLATAKPIAQLSKPSKYPEAFRLAVAEAYRSGASLKDVGMKFDMSKGQVAGILSRAGIFKEITRRVPAAPKKPRPERYHRLVLPKFKSQPFRERVPPAPFLGVSLKDRVDGQQCSFPKPQDFDPRNPRYCGQPTNGKTYCPACMSILYVPPQARNRNPRPRA